MKSSRFYVLILIALFVTAFWISPLQASGDPWDGTKVTDTLLLSNGEIIKKTDNSDGAKSDGDDDTPVLESIIKWIKGQISSKKDQKANNIRKNAGTTHYNMNRVPKNNSYSKD